MSLTRLLETSTATVLVEQRSDALLLEDEGGCVIGTVYDGGSVARTTELDAAHRGQISGSRGASLLKSHWGGYVALVCGGQDGTTDVIRDPSGFLPCYYAHAGDITLISSDVSLLFATGLLTPELDWTYLAGQLVFGFERPARTGLAGVKELLGGQRLTIAGGERTLGQMWSPWTFASTDLRIRDPREAVALVGDTTRMVVAAWGRECRHALLGVSGGLDSSIVAACLAEAGCAFSCVTLATNDLAGDERLFSRCLADALHVELFEEFEDLALVHLSQSDAAHLPRPLARSFAQSGDRIQVRLAERIGADMFLNGGGGDNVFCYLQAVAPLADRLLVEGVGAGLWETARDLSIMGDKSIPHVAWRALKRAMPSHGGHSWPATLRFRSAHAVEMAQGHVDHPWRLTTDRQLPGKIMHVQWILGIQNFLEGFHRERLRPSISPLMSQPLIEACLRVPTWMWCANGENRAVARKAFADSLPAAIVGRRSKGTPTSFLFEIFKANRGLIADMLNGGLLDRHGLLDMAELNRFLRAPDTGRGVDPIHVMTLVDVEAWARSWADRAASGVQ